MMIDIRWTSLLFFSLSIFDSASKTQNRIKPFGFTPFTLHGFNAGINLIEDSQFDEKSKKMS